MGSQEDVLSREKMGDEWLDKGEGQVCFKTQE